MKRHRQSREETIRVWAVRPILLYGTCFGIDSLGRDSSGNSAHKAPFLLINHPLEQYRSGGDKYARNYETSAEEPEDMAGQRHAGPEGNKAGGTEVSADLIAAGMFSETEQKGKNGTGSTANFCGNRKEKGQLENLGME